MNLTITPNFQIFSGRYQNQNNKPAVYTKLSALKADTVSFSGRIPQKTSSIIGDAIEQSYLSQMGKFIEAAKNFHIGLKNACAKLKDEGFVYDEVYNSKHPIKSRASFIDKLERKGSVQDTIRGTVYWTDQQNIQSFKKFIDTMKDEGYEIAVLREYNPQTDKFTKRPDLEIRQSGITEEDLEPLGTFLKKAVISRPRSSTY